MGRERRPFTRPTAYRDATLFVIATEGQKTEIQYFNDLKEELHSSRIHIQVIPPNENKSGPNHTLERLREFRREYSLRPDDALWLVIDVDRWGDKQLSQVAGECQSLHFGLGVSNPCFELWLLLHVSDLESYTPKRRKELEENKKSGSRTEIERELVALLGTYSKSNLRTSDFSPHINRAIEQAELLDVNPKDRWPQSLGSRVYLLVSRILEISGES